MNPVRLALAKLRALVRRDVVSDEIREEMQFHVDERTDEYQRRGLPADKARRSAVRRFGNLTLMQDRGYDVRGAGVIETVVQDVRYGARLLVKDRGFSLVAILTLALAMGASTALFSVIDAALLRPLPYPHPEELVDVTIRGTDARNGCEACAPAPSDLQDWRRAGGFFSHLAQAREANGRVIIDAGQPERLVVGTVSEDYLEVFGLAPFLGRTISLEDTRRGAAPVALLGHAYWQSRFASDRNVLGRTIRVAGETVTIVGVFPPGFHRGTSVWRPMEEADPSWAHMRGSGTPTYGRLRPGLSTATATQELTTISHQIAASNNRGLNFAVQLQSLYDNTVEGYRLTVRTLAGAVLGVLLIACINVAGLLLARGAIRQPELAIRASMGAGRVRLARQLLTESLLLAAVGTLGGLVLAWLTLDGLVAVLPMSLPANATPEISLRVLAFGVIASVAVSLLFGVVPALRLSRAQVGAHLARAGRRHGPALSRRGGQLLIAAEVALALVLLTGAGLMLRSFSRALSIDLGFDPGTFVTMEVFPVDETPAMTARYFPALLEKIRLIPGVTAAGAIDYAPLSRSSSYTGARHPGQGETEEVSVASKRILPGYFEAVGLTLRQGRFLSDPDMSSGLPIALLSERASRALFADGSAIGQEIWLSGRRPFTVIGVVSDVSGRDPFSADDPDIYLAFRPGADARGDTLTVIVRPASSAAGLYDSLRRAAADVGPPVIVERIRSGSQWFGDNVQTSRYRTVLIGLFGGLGLALTLVGIFGMTAYAVARRTQEIGVRMAFGARPIDVVARMVRDAAWPVLLGLVAGLAGAYYATRVIETLLFQTTPHDPATFAIVAVVMAFTALLAAWLPARRAARIDPVVALRAE